MADVTVPSHTRGRLPPQDHVWLRKKQWLLGTQIELVAVGRVRLISRYSSSLTGTFSGSPCPKFQGEAGTCFLFCAKAVGRRCSFLPALPSTQRAGGGGFVLCCVDLVTQPLSQQTPTTSQVWGHENKRDSPAPLPSPAPPIPRGEKMQQLRETPDCTISSRWRAQKWHTQEHTAPRTLAEGLAMGIASVHPGAPPGMLQEETKG